MTNTTTAPAWAAFYVEPHEGLADDALVPTFCSRCGGSGLPLGASEFLPAGGLCFGECGGRPGPIGQETVADARAREKRRAQRIGREERARLKRVAARDALVEAARAAHPAELAWLEARQDGSSFARSLWEQLATFAGGDPKELTERQWAAVTRCVARDAEEAAKRSTAAPVEVGRRVLAGTVVTVKEVEGYMGGPAWKMLVELEDGSRVYGSIPRAIDDQLWTVEGAESFYAPLRGAKVTFTATVERSDRDPAFGFFSRPTKAVAELAA